MNPDYYHILRAPRTADDRAIEKAYRRRVRETHPDVNKSADAMSEFLAIQRAYEALRDPARRRAYDRQTSPTAAWAHSESVRSEFGRGFSFRGGGRRHKINRAEQIAGVVQWVLVAVNLALGIACIYYTTAIYQLRAPKASAAERTEYWEPAVSTDIVIELKPQRDPWRSGLLSP